MNNEFNKMDVVVCRRSGIFSGRLGFLINRYKVMNAMVALKEFDVKQLARLSGVKLATVRTILNRERQLLEELGESPTGARGGRFRLYRIRPSEIEALREDLQKSYQELKVASEEQVRTREKESDAVPAMVIAAEDLLLSRFPERPAADDKSHLLHLAELALSNVDERRLSPAASPKLMSHIEALRLLISLSGAELNEQLGIEPPTENLPTLRENFVRVSDELVDLGESPLGRRILKRFADSPMVWTRLKSENRANDLLPASGNASSATHSVDRILDQIKSISSISDANRQFSAALVAAEKYLGHPYDGEPENCGHEYSVFLSRIKTRTYVVLTNNEIQLLAALPSFYCRNVVVFGLRSGPTLEVRSFLDALESFKYFISNKGLAVRSGCLEEYALACA